MMNYLYTCNRKEKIFFFFSIVLIVFLFMWNFYTLQYTPIPWLDEVYFASVTYSFMHGDGFTLGLGLGENVYHYGPVYFLLTSLSSLIGGFNMISFRIVGLLFSFAVAFMVYRILKLKSINPFVACAVVFLLLFDQLFIYCSHMGRMDLVAAFFVMIAFYVYEQQKQILNTKGVVIIATCFLLAVMTTARVAITAIPLGLAIFISMVKGKEWRKLFLLMIIPLVGLLVWIFLSYGSVSEFVDYFTKPTEKTPNQNFFQRFVGGTFDISPNHYPLVLLALITLVHSIKYKYFKEIYLYVCTILLFYLVVHGTNNVYSIMILPYYFIIIGKGLGRALENRSENKEWFGAMIIVMLICVVINIGVFMVKWLLIESSKEYRDGRLMTEWIGKNIPAGTIVLGSDIYYYACMSNNCSFKSLDQIYSTDEGTLAYIEKTRPVYLLYSDEEGTPEGKRIKELIKAELVAHYEPVADVNWLDMLTAKIGLINHSTYEGSLYRIIYKDKIK